MPPPVDAATVRALIQAYLAAQPPDARRALRKVRATIRTAVPAATEHFSYGIPGFRLDGQPLVWYAGFKQHFSLYPIGAAIRAAHAKALQGYATATGTVRFPLAEPVPVALVTRLVKARAVEARDRGRARA
jgi:uncharacterized protein YdhG (YjbR/CyaY superfamily)